MVLRLGQSGRQNRCFAGEKTGSDRVDKREREQRNERPSIFERKKISCMEKFEFFFVVFWNFGTAFENRGVSREVAT